jgi:hypothetical protein
MAVTTKNTNSRNNMSAAKSKGGKILRLTRTDSLVRYRQEFKTDTGIEERDITSHDAPLKKLDDALQALAPVAAKVLELPPDYAKGIVVHSVGISYTKAGTRSAIIYFKKALDATSTNHGMDTPSFQIDDAGDGEEGRRQVVPKHAALVDELIDQAEDYADGKRQQVQLPLAVDRAVKIKKNGGSLEMFPEGREPDGKDS